MSSPQRHPTVVPVLLFDGECGLCQRVVRVLLRLDHRGVLRFAPLQSSPAQAFLREHGMPADDFDTLVFVPDWTERASGEYLVRTAGVIGALRALGGLAGVFAALLSAVPRSWRDAAYRFIGHTRYRWFGPWQPRPLARPEWQTRFIG